MKLYRIEPKGFGSNSYLVTEDGVRAVAVDAGTDTLARAQRLGLTVGYVLLTHGHFDHIGGCAALQRAGAKIGCMAAERELALRHNLGREFLGEDVPPFTVDFTFSDGDALSLAGMEFRVLATPGHTAGSCCFLLGGVLFTGDTLFHLDVGRCDLPTGDETALRASLRRLLALGDMKIFPGHGEESSLAYEREHNGYLK